jgi:hypothetical protein
VTTYGVESRNEYTVSTVLDPRFKVAVFQTRENVQSAKLIVVSEMQLDLSISSTKEDPNPATTSSDA